MPDAFDAAVEDAILSDRKPKLAPPPGMVGTSSTSSQKPTIRITEASPLFAASFFIWLGVGDILSGIAVAMCVIEGIPAKVAFAAAAVVSGMLFVAVGVVIERLNETAHWTRQTAEAIRQSGRH